MMGITSIWHWLIVLAILVLIFGGKKVGATIREIKQSFIDKDGKKED